MPDKQWLRQLVEQTLEEVDAAGRKVDERARRIRERRLQEKKDDFNTSRNLTTTQRRRRFNNG